MPLRLRAHAVIAATLMLVSVACASPTKDTGLPDGPTKEPVAVSQVQATASNTFLPKEITVKVGVEVTWVFTPLHNAQADDGTFNSHPGCAAATTAKCSKENDVFKFKFAKAGDYPYFCAIHGIKGGFATGTGMVGKVTVQA
jgi:plastocyanin